MREAHESSYVTTDAGTYHRFMRRDNAFAVSAATLAVVARALEDRLWWYERACEMGVIFW
jgi:hypothetical protein